MNAPPSTGDPVVPEHLIALLNYHCQQAVFHLGVIDELKAQANGSRCAFVAGLREDAQLELNVWAQEAASCPTPPSA